VSKSETPPKADDPKVDDSSPYRADFPRFWPPRIDVANLADDGDEATLAYAPAHKAVAAPKVVVPADIAPAPVAENLRKIRDRWRDSKASFALSQTLRPVAVRLRSFSLVYPLSILALAMSGAALYLSRPMPSESVRVSVTAPSISDEVAASEEPPSSTASAAAIDAPSTANKLDVLRSPAASSSALQAAPRRKATTKSATQR